MNGHVKGTNLVVLRKYMRKNHPMLEKILLEQLSEKLKNIYYSVVTSTMTPIEDQVIIYEKTADLLFKKSEKPMFELAKLLSEQSFNGIYKVFIKIPSVNYIVRKVAQLWETYFDKGHAITENVKQNSLDYVLVDFPDYPKSMIDYASGHIYTLMTICGAKNIGIKCNLTDPNAWRWHIEWD